MSLFTTNEEPQLSEVFTVVEHVGLPGEDGLFNEALRTPCSHTASKQFDRLKFDSNPLTASIALFKGEELIQFWSPAAL